MVKSVRLNDALEKKLEEAAKMSGRTVSSLIRGAIERRCDEILSERLGPRLADVAGTVKSGGGRARRTGDRFAESLLRRKRRGPR